jgi:hypothetical protein
LAVGAAYWYGFAYNDYQDAPLDGLDREKGQSNFFVGIQISPKWISAAFFIVAGVFITGAYHFFQWTGIGVMAVSLLVVWAYSGRPLRLKSRAGLDLLTHAIFVETYPYVITVLLLETAWIRLDMAMIAILLLGSLSAQLEQQLSDYELDARTEPNFTTWLGPRRTLTLLRITTVSLALVGVGFAIVGTIPGYLIPFGLIAAPMLARRLLRQPGKTKGMALTAGTLAAGLLYAAFILSVSAFWAA